VELYPFLPEQAGPRAETVKERLNNGTYVLILGVDRNVLRPRADPVNIVLGYERTTPQSGGLVLMADGSVRRMSKLEFSVANKLKGPAPE